ncbi:MAG: fumarate hydratase C-terminal domain-containing protein [Candidatus Omnitrophica bacterium]|nr:fumarate hydratase C-terminal domain-containing protein [Candidatus Omnitrophota bacterium]
MKKITAPLKKEDIKGLRAGDLVYLSGIIYTARDQAHKKLAVFIKRNRKIPFDIKNTIIYYCGPTPSPEGKVIGSCGPTTSSRMDEFTPALIRKGVVAMIGKGRRSRRVREFIKRYKSVYFLAPSGCGAYLALKVKKKRLVAFKNLGPEAILELEVENFPLIVGIDSRGNDVYQRIAYSV